MSEFFQPCFCFPEKRLSQQHLLTCETQVRHLAARRIRTRTRAVLGLVVWALHDSRVLPLSSFYQSVHTVDDGTFMTFSSAFAEEGTVWVALLVVRRKDVTISCVS